MSNESSEQERARGKRRPDKELTHENWDQEEEPEEKGEFKKATDEQLKGRKILTAKRKQKATDEPPSNPFGAISFGSLPSSVPGFNFSGTGAAPTVAVPPTTTANGTSGSASTNPLSMFNFAAPTGVPKFDFSCISSSSINKKEEESTSNSTPDNSSSPKISSSGEASLPVENSSSSNSTDNAESKPEGESSNTVDSFTNNFGGIIDESSASSRRESEADTKESVPVPEEAAVEGNSPTKK